MGASQQQASRLGTTSSSPNLMHALQATYFDQKFHSTFFLAPESGTEAAKPQGAKSIASSKQQQRPRQAAETGRQLALASKQDQPEEQDAAADDSAGFGSDVDGDQHSQHPMQLQLRRPEQDEAQMDQLYLLVESQKAAMR